MLLADRDGALATEMVADLVLDHLNQLDPAGEFRTLPAVHGTCGDALASVTRLPVMSGMADGDTAARQEGMASVTQLWV